jgi:hypothetical protein
MLFVSCLWKKKSFYVLPSVGPFKSSSDTVIQWDKVEGDHKKVGRPPSFVEGQPSFK